MTQGTIAPVTSGTPAADGGSPGAEHGRLDPTELEEHGRGRLRWGAVFGGAVTALGVWALMYALGIALGLSSVDLDDARSLRASGIFTGVWGLISPLVALFVGGLVASRAASVLTKGAGTLHGLVVWGLTTVVGTWLLAALISAAVNGAFAMGRTAMEARGAGIGHAAQGTGQGYAAGGLGLDMNEAVAPIDRRLQTEGKAAINVRQLESATREILRDGLRQGTLDRDALGRAVADGTALGAADTEELTGRIMQQFHAALNRGEPRAAEAAQMERVAGVTAKAFWGVFGCLLFGMVGAIGGALVGTTPRMQEWAARAQLEAYERSPYARARLAHAATRTLS